MHSNELIDNLERIHTTAMGTERIKRNLELDTDDAVGYCKSLLCDPVATMSRRGKNWYIRAKGCEITVNASSYTIITAHKIA